MQGILQRLMSQTILISLTLLDEFLVKYTSVRSLSRCLSCYVTPWSCHAIPFPPFALHTNKENDY